MSKNQVTPRKTCAECKRTVVESNYYKCDSPLYSDGRFHICTRCLTEMFNGDNGYQIVLMTLHAMNKPFLQDIWASSENSGVYFRQINSLHQYSDLTWENSDFNESQGEFIEKEKEEFDIDEETIKKYGTGYTNDEYRAFERKYNNLIENYKEQTAMHSEGLIIYIRYRVREEMSTANGDFKEAKEWGNLARNAAIDAKLNVSALSKSDITGGVDLMTQLAEAVETKLSVIPLLPKVLAQPYDDADLVLWANIDYNRRLEGKSPAKYRDIWNFYDDMLDEHFTQQGLNEKEIVEEKAKRDNVFKDLADVYVEPLYEDDDQ